MAVKKRIGMIMQTQNGSPMGKERFPMTKAERKTMMMKRKRGRIHVAVERRIPVKERQIEELTLVWSALKETIKATTEIEGKITKTQIVGSEVVCRPVGPTDAIRSQIRGATRAKTTDATVMRIGSIPLVAMSIGPMIVAWAEIDTEVRPNTDEETRAVSKIKLEDGGTTSETAAMKGMTEDMATEMTIELGGTRIAGTTTEATIAYAMKETTILIARKTREIKKKTLCNEKWKESVGVRVAVETKVGATPPREMNEEAPDDDEVMRRKGMTKRRREEMKEKRRSVG